MMLKSSYEQMFRPAQNHHQPLRASPHREAFQKTVSYQLPPRALLFWVKLQSSLLHRKSELNELEEIIVQNKSIHNREFIENCYSASDPRLALVQLNSP